jgi:hypothetical protein
MADRASSIAKAGISAMAAPAFAKVGVDKACGRAGDSVRTAVRARRFAVGAGASLASGANQARAENSAVAAVRVAALQQADQLASAAE